ncbi:MAG: DUF1538 domain-containing protein [Oscillospiraceae bacterium]|nr:DUF1538 domain-containing protein [Oscillospiraceae bacterium]
MNVLLSKFKEVSSAVSPVVILVLILNFTLAPASGMAVLHFIFGAAAIVLGLSILLFGIELGIMPFGKHMGETFLKSNKLWFVIIVGFLLGFFVNIGEPDLQVLAGQVSSVMGGYISMAVILVAVSIGTGIMLALGILRIVKNVALNVVFAVTYGAILILAVFSSSDMLAIGFDASGATTGALTVPLVLAMSLGVAAMKKDSKSAEDDSFGLVGVMSTGAILGVLILNLFVKTDTVVGFLEIHDIDTGSLFGPFIAEIPQVAFESFIALLPMVLLLFIFQRRSFRLHHRSFGKMLAGFLYTYVGLIIFLVGVNAGFMNLGNIIGYSLASHDNKMLLVGLGFVLGMLVILTEPAVYVLTRQIESVTSGYIKRKIVLVTLSIGVAFAVGLAMLRIVVPGIQLWHYLLPGYVLSMAMTFFVPKIFVGIAFDSGGVASGPMTATFVLAFAQGASEAIEYADILIDSFGVIAMVAMTPLIALQVLGLIYKFKSRKNEV